MAVDHLRKGWQNVAARMQQMACTQNANCVISIHILVDQNGDPITWLEPDIVKLEPAAKMTAAISHLIKSRFSL